MKSLPEGDRDSNFYAGGTTYCIERVLRSNNLDQKASSSGSSKVLANFLSSAFSIFEGGISPSRSKKESKARNGWTTVMRKVASGGMMRRLQERFLGASKAVVLNSGSDIWLLGMCYSVSTEESSHPDDPDNGLVAFQHDFSSRVWMTYRKGFDAIGDTKFTSDANWGCMIRSSQMLVAQALVCHHLGRSWRKPAQAPYDPKYIELLHFFGDSMACAFSIHNLIQAGTAYGLAAGSWVGPYAMCRSWEALVRSKTEISELANTSLLPMTIYIVSGDEDGERGGAPVVCIDVVSRLCSNFCKEESNWAPLLLLVPLVIGLDKVNPRYIPSLWETFTFPQSLGILGGKPGASTYIVGVQDNMALYLDPHEVQMVANVSEDNLHADTSSYHCSTVRHLPLEQIDPSLAIGFYCRDKDDFDDFCVRAIHLAEKSSGAPLFTIAQLHQPSIQIWRSNADHGMGDAYEVQEAVVSSDANQYEDDWQLL